MSYTPTNWSTGDTITASALNKMEQGIADGSSGALIVNVSGESGSYVGGEPQYGETLDATFAEIYNALSSGTPVYIRRVSDTNGPSTDYTCSSALFNVLSAYKYADTYRVHASCIAGWNTSNYLTKPAIVTFSASGPNAYPFAFVLATPENNSVIDVYG